MLFRSNDKFEDANTITHGVGVFVSLVGGAILIVRAALSGDPFAIVSSSIFAFAMLALYSASTLYHAAPEGTGKQRLKRIDHCAIYLLIAGTYTPIALVGLRGGWGWSLFGVIWGLTAAGFVFKLFYTGRFKLLSTGIYIAMGWLALVEIVPLIARLSPLTLVWLVA
ncbi:MAG: hemolysin III family protein, partial [Gemmatimonadota bacterium]